MFVIDEKNPLKSIREVSYFFFALLKNLPPEELNKLTSQKFNFKKRRALMWKLHLLNCACDRAEKGLMPTAEDEMNGRVERDTPRPQIKKS